MSLRTAARDTKLIANLLETAEAEARALGDPEPQAEHLLLSALLVDDASAREALASIASTADASTVRTAITAVHAASLATVGIDTPTLAATLPPPRGPYHSEISAQEVFQRAHALSRKSRTGLRSAHILLAAAEREHGTVARILEHLGLDRHAVIVAATRAAAGE